MRRYATTATALLSLAVAAGPALADNEGIPSVPLDQKNMAHVNNVPNTSGNTMAPFERRQTDGTLDRYMVVATQGNGFDIVKITDPTHPTTVGRYLLPEAAADPNKLQKTSAGLNYHAWVDVNPRRNIVALTIEDPGGRAVRHNGGAGLQLVDIADVTNPKPLGKLDDLSGPHTLRMIGDNCIYTSLNTYIVDYTNPNAPTSTSRGNFQGHEFYEDPNIPNRTYMGSAVPGQWKVLDTTNCLDPKVIVEKTDNAITNAHEVYPAPDSSYVGVADFGNGLDERICPGGGIHFWDISGKYVAGASLMTPKKMGAYFAPYRGPAQQATALLPPGTTNGLANSPPCTMHSWQMQPERQLALGGLYSGGTWVLDPTRATQTGGAYTEFDSGGAKKTTWGNTLGNNRDAADFVNASQWLPFDVTEAQEKMVLVNGWFRGFDVYQYTQPVAKKMSRLQVNGSAATGSVTGKLDRYAVLTYTGWANKPLEGRTLDVSAGGQTVTVTTAADGTFSAPLGLAAGTHSVTVSWGGDDRFAPNSVSRSVTA